MVNRQGRFESDDGTIPRYAKTSATFPPLASSKDGRMTKYKTHNQAVFFQVQFSRLIRFFSITLFVLPWTNFAICKSFEIRRFRRRCHRDCNGKRSLVSEMRVSIEMELQGMGPTRVTNVRVNEVKERIS